MSATPVVTYVAGCVLAGSAGMLVACSGEDSGPPSVSSFHYVETVTGHIDGDPIDSREDGYYRAPDAARIIGDADYSPLGLENIVIGSQVWERRSSGWRASTKDVDCYNALVKMAWILSLGRELEGFTDEGDGPSAGGERTRRYSYASDDAGRNLIIGTERNLADTPENAELLAQTNEVFGDLKGNIEIAVGDETGRVYSYILSMSGSRLTQRRDITVEYEVPVAIEPPPNVAAAPESKSNYCDPQDSDFPWIPAAIAAVLGPLLFLVAAAFVWPRRPWMRG